VAETKSKRKGRPALLLDGDILGLAAATFIGTVVLALGLLWRDIERLTAAVRAGLAFVLTYVVVFLFVNLILRTARRELAEQRRAEREKRDMEKAALEAESASDESGES